MASYSFTTSTKDISNTCIPTNSKTINNVIIGGEKYKVSLDSEAFREAMKIYLNNNTPNLISLTCYNCGASINQKINDHILKCPYCKSVYLTGINQINSR